MIDAGAHVAIATNTNPGSSNTTSMSFCIALAVREMGMTVGEALQAATLGGANALRRDDVGRLAPGARADAVMLDAASYIDLVYRPGVPLVSASFVAATRPNRIADIRIGVDLPVGVPVERHNAVLAVASGCTIHNTLSHAPSVSIELRDTAAAA
jgi:predicted amidohydrolase YtcJ